MQGFDSKRASKAKRRDIGKRRVGRRSRELRSHISTQEFPMNIEQAVMEKLKVLPSDKQQEVLDFVEFLEHQGSSGQKAKAEVIFDEWAANLAKEKGFAHLTEEDVAHIVRDFRGRS